MAKGKAVTLDWSKEEKGKGGGAVRIPENDYIAKVKSVESFTSSNNNPGLLWKFTISEGKHSGKELWDRTMLMPKNYWSVRRILENMGVDVPESGKQKLPVDKLKGKEIGITVVDGEPYQDKNDKTRIRSEIADYVEPDVVRSGGVDDEDEEDLDDDELEEDDEDELDEDEDDEDDEEEEDEDDLDDLDRKGLKAHIKENDLEVKVTKKMDEDAIRQAIRDAEENDEEDDDEEEDLEEVDLDDL